MVGSLQVNGTCAGSEITWCAWGFVERSLRVSPRLRIAAAPVTSSLGDGRCDGSSFLGSHTERGGGGGGGEEMKDYS